MATLRDSARAMKVINPMELPLHAQQMMAQLKEKDKEIESLNAKLAQNRLDGVFQNAQEVDGVKVVFALLSVTGSDALRALCDKAKERPCLLYTSKGQGENHRHRGGKGLALGQLGPAGEQRHQKQAPARAEQPVGQAGQRPGEGVFSWLLHGCLLYTSRCV